MSKKDTDTVEPLQDEALPIDVEAEVVAKPKPGDVDYDWTADYGTADLFRYTLPDGKLVALRTIAAVYTKTWMFKLRNARSNAEVEFAALERAACPAALAVIESLDDDAEGDPVDALFKAWLKNGTSNGEGDDGLSTGN